MRKKLKLLIGGARSKIFHLKEFSEALSNFGIESKLVLDIDYADGFPSRNVASWFQTNKKFKNLIAEFKPDAVFVDRLRHFALQTVRANLPLLVHLRGDYWSELKWAKETIYKTIPRRIAIKQWEKMGNYCLSKSELLLPICKYLEDVAKNHYPDKKTLVLYQGIDSSHWHQSKKMNLKHPCVGLLQDAKIWGKTKEMLTLTKVMKQMPNVTFYWVGDGPYRDYVLPHLQKFENFKWLGSLDYPEKVREYLMAIDVYALVSGIDMSPLTLQEAQLMEKPVVATQVGGIPELMVDNKTGILVQKGDSKGLEEAISALINDEKKQKEMGKNGRNFITENFSWNVIAKKFADYFKNNLN